MVMGGMITQLCLSYSSLPDVRTLSGGDIRWFYDGLRDSLKEATKPKDK